MKNEISLDHFSMGIQWLTLKMEVLRKLQRNLAGSSDYAHYYHNKKLKEWVDGTKIRQIFLLPHSRISI